MFKTVLSAALISGIAAVSFAGSAEARGFGGYHGGYHGGFHKHGFHGGRFYRFHRFHGGRGFGRGFRRFGVNEAGGVSTARLGGAGETRPGA